MVRFWYSHLDGEEKILVLLFSGLFKEVTVPGLGSEFPLGQHKFE